MASDPPPKQADDEAALPLLEETAEIGKRRIVTGRVRVSTLTEPREHWLRDELAGERIAVERVAIDRTLGPEEAPPTVRTEGDVTIVPVLEEVLVVSKRLVLKEELRITRQATREVVEFPVTLRKQRAVVERIGPEGSPNPQEGQEQKP